MHLANLSAREPSLGSKTVTLIIWEIRHSYRPREWRCLVVSMFGVRYKQPPSPKDPYATGECIPIDHCIMLPRHQPKHTTLRMRNDTARSMDGLIVKRPAPDSEARALKRFEYGILDRGNCGQIQHLGSDHASSSVLVSHQHTESN